MIRSVAIQQDKNGDKYYLTEFVSGKGRITLMETRADNKPTTFYKYAARTLARKGKQAAKILKEWEA